MRKLLAISVVALLASVVGCSGDVVKKVGPVVPACDGGSGPALHLNKQNVCVECTTNADCKDTFQCNLITAVCEPIPTTVIDAGPPPTCQPGAVRCAPDRASVQDCTAGLNGATSWVSRAPGCPSGYTCNPKTLTCATCSPGESVCNPENGPTYDRCKDDGTAFDTVQCSTSGQTGFQCKTRVEHQDLADGGVIPGAITCQLCVPHSSQCGQVEDGGVGILNCDSTGALQTFQSCYPTNVCDNQSGTPKCGAAVCFPGQNRCADASNNIVPNNTDVQRQSCNGDGTAWVQSNCTTGTVCGPTANDTGACLSPCDVVAASSSYQGCDFWGALTSNNPDTIFTGNSAGGSAGTTDSEYAFVVSNTSDTLTAHVTVSMDSVSNRNATVAPGAVQAIRLPWRPICGSGLAKFGAHLISDVPVTVYQFNPLSSAKATSRSCSGDFDCDQNSGEACINNRCNKFAFTADASLLLPTHLLGTSYVVVASDQISERDSVFGETPLSGMMSIVATQDGTTLQVHFAGSTVAGNAGLQASCNVQSGNLPAKAAGQTVNYTLSAGQVLQFLSADTGNPTCVTSPRQANASPGETIQVCLWPNDLTGTIVTSVTGQNGSPAKPIAVFGGADCTYKPYNQVACDHIEEEMFPFSTWGKHYVGVKTKSYANATMNYTDYWRIVSACGTNSCPNGTTVRISPPVPQWRQNPAFPTAQCQTAGTVTTCTLPPVANGSTAPWLEFQHGSSFDASSDQPIVLAQYFVSESATGSDTEGDPSLVLAPPVEQWRSNYSVLAPNTYLHNYLNLTIDGVNAGACQTCGQVKVDGVVVPASEWTNIPNTTFFAAVHPLCGSAQAACTGSHKIDTGTNGVPGAAVGVVVYGYDSYVSYGYTGGLDLQTITVIQPGG